MGGWMAHNPELADELFLKNCPDDLRKQIEDEEVEIGDIPWDIAGPIWGKVESAYGDRMADIADAARDAAKEGV